MKHLTKAEKKILKRTLRLYQYDSWFELLSLSYHVELDHENFKIM